MSILSLNGYLYLLSRFAIVLLNRRGFVSELVDSLRLGSLNFMEILYLGDGRVTLRREGFEIRLSFYPR